MPTGEFYDWLEEPIQWKGSECSRAEAIREFVDAGLVPWVMSKGYAWAFDAEYVRNAVASGFFRNRAVGHLESDWSWCMVRSSDEWCPGDQWHFHHVLSEDAWEHFWSRWGDWEDVNPELAWWGLDRRLDIQDFVWHQIHLAGSKQTRVVNELLDIVESPEEVGNQSVPDTRASKQVDVYLQEAEGWGGYRR